jgi:hypothetical protein
MSSNTHASGSVDGTVIFDRAVDHLNVFVDTGVTFSISLDFGENFLTLPAGFHSFRVGLLKEVYIQADGDWQLIAVQA